MELKRREFNGRRGLEVHWDGWVIDFHEIYYPGWHWPDQHFVDAWKHSENRGFVLYTNREVRLVTALSYTMGHWPNQMNSEPHDMMPLYRMCQACWKGGGEPYVLIDWMQDRGLL